MYLAYDDHWRTGRRVDNLGANVSAWHESPEAGGNGSSTYDVCSECCWDLEQDPHAHDDDLTPYNGDPQGEDGWGGDVVHPPYDDGEYTCKVCGVPLRD